MQQHVMPAGEPVRSKAFESALEVVSHFPVNAEYRQLVLKAPGEILAACHAGQFFNLLCPQTYSDAPFLRRPMSIYGFYPEKGELHFLYKVVGAGTRGLSTLAAGDHLSVFGPLGTPFTIRDEWKNLTLVARGVGLATLAPLALEAKARGCHLTAVCSARKPELLMSLDYFRDLGANVITLTDEEGTSGPENLANVIEDLIGSGKVDALYTCGSKRMLATLQELGTRFGVPGQVALEQQMACGIGLCHCCVRPFYRDGELVHLRVCHDGPVFDMREAIA